MQLNQNAVELGKMPKVLLRGRRRAKRTWTGFIDGERCWVGRAVRLPSGEEVWVKRVQRGVAKLVTSQRTAEALPLYTYAKASALTLPKNPSAVALGKLKAGAREVKSDLKAQTSRSNGLKHRSPSEAAQEASKLPRRRQQRSGSSLINWLIRRTYGVPSKAQRDGPEDTAVTDDEKDSDLLRQLKAVRIQQAERFALLRAMQKAIAPAGEPEKY